jgi:protein-S-isoprenylcysteine O-methyltransferase Ste14
MPLTFNYIVLALLLVYLSAYLGKLMVMSSRDNIKANVLAKGMKENKIRLVEFFVKITTFIWGLLWFLLPLVGIIYNKDFNYFKFNSQTRTIGIALLLVGLIIFIVSAISMKSSWRVGIDKNTKTALIKNGIYKISRNPAFVGFDLMFVGLFITHPNLLTLYVAASCIISIHFLIKQEEQHLTAIFGKEYVDYKQITPRYLIF